MPDSDPDSGPDSGQGRQTAMKLKLPFELAPQTEQMYEGRKGRGGERLVEGRKRRLDWAINQTNQQRINASNRFARGFIT